MPVLPALAMQRVTMLLGPIDRHAVIEFELEGKTAAKGLRLVWKRTKGRPWPNEAA
jgi:hypothetical protein